MNRICVLAVYFGALPASFDSWLATCRCNPEIDFLLVTDSDADTKYANVSLCKMTLAQMKQLAERKLGMSISLESAYKVCDYRPAFGEIFADMLTGYDYWGHCDLDMVLGDIMGFMRRYRYESYDKFLCWGHLSFYRNTPEVNGRYRLSGSRRADYDKIFTSWENYTFDELNGIFRIYQTHLFPVFQERIFADVSHVYRQLKLIGESPSERDQLFYWENGRTMRAVLRGGEVTEEEYIYIHYQKRRMAIPDFDVFSCQGFYIAPDRYIEKKNPGPPSAEDFALINPYMGERAELASEKAERKNLSRQRFKRVTKRYRMKLTSLFRSERKKQQ